MGVLSLFLTRRCSEGLAEHNLVHLRSYLLNNEPFVVNASPCYKPSVYHGSGVLQSLTIPKHNLWRLASYRHIEARHYTDLYSAISIIVMISRDVSTISSGWATTVQWCCACWRLSFIGILSFVFYLSYCLRSVLEQVLHPSSVATLSLFSSTLPLIQRCSLDFIFAGKKWLVFVSLTVPTSPKQ